MNTKTVGIHEWLAYGYLGTLVGHGGTSCLYGINVLSILSWIIATYGFYMIDNIIDIRELRVYGAFTTDTNEPSGVSCFLGNHPLSYFVWNITTDAFSMSSKTIDIRQWLAYGSLLTDVVIGGVLCMTGNFDLSDTFWSIATTCFLYVYSECKYT